MKKIQYKQVPLVTIPADIVSAADYETLAPAFMHEQMHAYISGGCGDEVTLRKNREAFLNCEIRPRILRKFSQANCTTHILEQKLPHPIMLGPVAHQRLIHPEGELATVTGAEAMATPFIASTLSNFSLEDIAKRTHNLNWFQLYFQRDKEITLSLVRRAEKCGYNAIVITVDAPINGLRFRAQRAGFSMPSDIIDANLHDYSASAPRQLGKSQSIVFDGLMKDAPSWDDIAWLRQHTQRPLFLKGITHPEDAKLAQSMGIDGIIVSNHGGRSVDGIPASLHLMPEIRESVGINFPILLDSGIRSGGDIFKAIAAGANAVLIGRLQVYALAVAGALGVAHLVRTLVTELEITMALAGCTNLQAITLESIKLNRN